MGNLMRDSESYYTFLQNSLAQSATEQSFGETIQSEADLIASSATQSQYMTKEMGTEILVSSLPAIFPTAINLYQKAQKIYQNIKDIGSQVSKVSNAVQTLPDDVKTLYGSKVNQIQSLLKDGGNENIAKAKSLYGELQDTVQKAATTGKSIATETANKMVNLKEATISKGQEVVSGMQEQAQGVVSGIQEQAKGVVSGIQEQAKGVVSGMQEQAQGVVSGMQEQSQGVVSGIQEQAKGVVSGIKEQAQKIAPKEFTDRYVAARNKADQISSRLELETDPATKESLNVQLQNAKTEMRTSSRLIELNTPSTTAIAEEGSTLLSKIGTGVSGALEGGAVIGGVLGSIEEAKGGMQSIGQKIQTGIGQEQALGIVSQKGAQVVQATKQAFGQTREAALKSTTEIQEQGEELASKAQSTLESGRGAVSDLMEGAKSSDILGSIAEKGTLETLGEVTGIEAIPVVGEVVGLAGLVYGAISGIEDLFSHHSSAPPQPLPQAPVTAAIVHQAGL